MESRSELLQTQEQNPRQTEYNAAWRTNSSSGLASQKLRTSSAPDGLRSMLTAIQGTGSEGSTTSQEMREDPSLSEARQEGSLSPDTESSPTVASARNTGPSTMSAGFQGSAASSLDGVRERAEAVLRDAESVLKQEPSWAADAPAQGRPSSQFSQTGRETGPFSDSYNQQGRAAARRTSITQEDLRFHHPEEMNGQPTATNLSHAPGQERLLARPVMSSFDSPEQPSPAADAQNSQAPTLQHRSPDAARGSSHSPSGVTHPLHAPAGEHWSATPRSSCSHDGQMACVSSDRGVFACKACH